MPITRTGEVATGSFGTAQTGSVSITVPADATLAVIGCTSYKGVANLMSGGSIAIGGVNATVIAGGDSDTANYMGCLWYLPTPATGTQTLSWFWLGGGPTDRATPYAVVFYTGINTADLVRDTFGAQQSTGNPSATDVMTAAAGDVLVAYAFRFASSGTAVWTWSGATNLGQYVAGESAATFGEAFPTAPTSVSASETVANSTFGGILALVVKGAAVVIVDHWDVPGAAWDTAGQTWDPVLVETPGLPAIATLTGSLITGATLAGAWPATAALAGALTTVTRLVGAVSATAALSGTLTAIPAGAALAGALSATAQLGATLTTGIRGQGAVSATATLAAPLTAGITFGGPLLATASVTGALITAISAAGTLLAQATLTGALTTLPAGLSGTLAATAQTSATLTTAVQFQSALLATATLTGTLTPGTTVAGALPAVATLAGSLTTVSTLASALLATATLGGSLTTAAGVLLTGALTATASLAGTLLIPPAIGVGGDVIARATIAGALTTGIPLAGAVLARATLSGDLQTGLPLPGLLGQLDARAFVQGTLAVGRAFVGVLVATATLAGELEGAAPPPPPSREPETEGRPRDDWDWYKDREAGQPYRVVVPVLTTAGVTRRPVRERRRDMVPALEHAEHGPRDNAGWRPGPGPWVR